MTRFGWVARDPWELRLQRVAMALLVYAGFHHQRHFLGQPFPVGIARWIDFSFIGDPAAAGWVHGALLVVLALYVAGKLMPVAVAGMLFIYAGGGALAYSQGALAHHSQLLAMVLVGQLIAYLQTWWARRAAGASDAALGAHTLATHYSLEVMAAGYALAGLMKVVLSHGRWLAQVPMIVTEVSKAHGQAYCTTGVADFVARGDAIAGFITAHPTVTRVFLGGGVLVELCAAAVLIGRRSAFLIGIGLFAMHRAIDLMMTIEFRENEALVLIYFINVPFLLVVTARALARRAANG